MDITALVSTAAAIVAVPAYALIARPGSSGSQRWWAPAVLSAAFAGWTVYSVLDGGVLGFWPEHVGTPWQTQIWLDLLLMTGTAWYLLQPRLRSLGIRPLPWLALVVATGAVGMLALLARLLHAEAAAASATSRPEAEHVVT